MIVLVCKITSLQPVWFMHLTLDTWDTVRFQQRWQASTMPKMRFSAEFTCKYLPLSHWGKALWGSVLSYKTPDVTNSCCCRQNNRPHCHLHSTRRLSGDSKPVPLLLCRQDELWLQAASGSGGSRKALKALHSLSTSKSAAASVYRDWKLFSYGFFNVRINLQQGAVCCTEVKLLLRLLSSCLTLLCQITLWQQPALVHTKSLPTLIYDAFLRLKQKKHLSGGLSLFWRKWLLTGGLYAPMFQLICD